MKALVGVEGRTSSILTGEFDIRSFRAAIMDKGDAQRFERHNGAGVVVLTY